MATTSQPHAGGIWSSLWRDSARCMGKLRSEPQHQQLKPRMTVGMGNFVALMFPLTWMVVSTPAREPFAALEGDIIFYTYIHAYNIYIYICLFIYLFIYLSIFIQTYMWISILESTPKWMVFN